jgi:hypothetical protein
VPCMSAPAWRVSDGSVARLSFSGWLPHVSIATTDDTNAVPLDSQCQWSALRPFGIPAASRPKPQTLYNGQTRLHFTHQRTGQRVRGTNPVVDTPSPRNKATPHSIARPTSIVTHVAPSHIHTTPNRKIVDLMTENLGFDTVRFRENIEVSIRGSITDAALL